MVEWLRLYAFIVFEVITSDDCGFMLRAYTRELFRLMANQSLLFVRFTRIRIYSAWGERRATFNMKSL